MVYSDVGMCVCSRGRHRVTFPFFPVSGTRPLCPKSSIDMATVDTCVRYNKELVFSFFRRQSRIYPRNYNREWSAMRVGQAVHRAEVPSLLLPPVRALPVTDLRGVSAKQQ